jgi:transposase
MDMTISSIKPNRVEVVTSVQCPRHWTPEQKLEIVKQTNEPRSSVYLVAGQHGLTAAQLFHWGKAYLEGVFIKKIFMANLY